jgi:hypothetical protein
MCSTGQCGWCECAVDGRPSVRTCEVPLRAGLEVRGEHAWPRVGADLFQLLGVGSRFVPPTFYHHRFLRPKALRKRYLDVIRAFGGRGRLRPGGAAGHPATGAPPVVPRTRRTESPDVLVIGGGRAGLLAAIAAAGEGARTVVLERREDGGDGPLMAAAQRAGVDVWVGTAATGWYEGLVTALGPSSAWELRPRAVVAATGTYELVPPVRGADRPGVMAARLVRDLVARYRVLPGERALCVGEGSELEAARVALIGAGAQVVARVPTAELVRIGGRRAVGWAEVRDEGPRPRRLTVDLVVFGDRTPNLDLVLAAGADVGWRAGRLTATSSGDGATSVAGLFVASMADVEDACRAAGAAAARHATVVGKTGRTPTTDPGRRPGDPPRAVAMTLEQGGEGPSAEHIHGDAVLCFCEDVRAWEIRAEQRAGYADPELIKRRTGALTGPCQGKYCLSAVTCAVAGVGADRPLRLPTSRPPLQPTRLGDLLAVDPQVSDEGAPR